MSEKIAASQKISLKSTKQEMLDAYNDLLKSMDEKDKMTLKPEETNGRTAKNSKVGIILLRQNKSFQ